MTSDKFDGVVGLSGIHAIVVRHHLLTLGVGKHLIPTQAVTVTQPYLFSTLPTHCVHAVVCTNILDLPKVVVVQGHARLWVDGFQIPTEGLALKPVPKAFPRRQVTYVNISGAWIHLVIEVFPVVHPSLSNSCSVLVDNFGDATGESVR